MSTINARTQRGLNRSKRQSHVSRAVARAPASLTVLSSALNGRNVNKTNLSTLKLPDLQDVCASLGVDAAGRRKADLVQLILDAASEPGSCRDYNGDKSVHSPHPTASTQSASSSDVIRREERSANRAETAAAHPAPVSPSTRTPSSVSPNDRKLRTRLQPGVVHSRHTSAETLLDIGSKRFNKTCNVRKGWLEGVRRNAVGNPTGVCVTWLGTSSGAPTSARNISCTAVRIGDPESVMLVDAGEGSQYQFVAFGLDLTSVQQIFVTHHHGDHVFGIAGVIAARNEAFAAKGLAPTPLAIFGPPGTADLVIMSVTPGMKTLATSAPCAKLAITEWCLTVEQQLSPTAAPGADGVFTVARRPPDQLSPRWTGPRDMRVLARTRQGGAAHHDKSVPICDGYTWTVAGVGGTRVQAAQLYHRVPCWGYVFQEPTSNSAAGGGRKVVILGDTHNSTPIMRIARDAHVLSHEATFLHAMYNKAVVATHSTGRMAGAFANAINAKQLVLTHFSGRYGHGEKEPGKALNDEDEQQKLDEQDLGQLKREAVRAMQSDNVICAHDGFTYRL